MSNLCFFFLCNTFSCILHLLVLQVFILQVFSMKYKSSSSISVVDFERYQSSYPPRLQVFKIKFFKYKFFKFKRSSMPVVTRSMAKRRVTDSPSLSTGVPRDFSFVPPLTSLNETSIPSSSSLPTISSLVFENSFEISNEANFEFSKFCQPCTTVALSHYSHNFQMESECNVIDPAMKVDSDPPDIPDTSQDGIMKVLLAISSQMVANTQDLQDKITKNAHDLQDQLACNNLKLSGSMSSS